MRSNVENLGALERRIDISISQNEIQEEVDKRLKQLAKTTKMHGFRPGKVPLKLVSQRYGAEVREEVLGEALQQAFKEAVREHDLRVVGYPRYEAKENDNTDSGQYNFSALFEVYPDIVLGDLSQQTVERPVTEISASDIDNTIEMIRKQQVKYQAVERAVTEGDRAIIDYHGTVGGLDFEGGKADNVHLIVGEGAFLKDFETALLGMQSGEEKSFSVTFPEDYGSQDVAGKTVTFNVKMKSVELPELPEVDSEFAKQLGIQDGDLEKMREGIRHDLEREILKRINWKLKEQAMRCLMETTFIEAPNALVNQEVERLMEDARKELTSRGMSASNLPLKPEMFKEKAEHRIKLGLVLTKVMQTHHLKATPEQVRSVIIDAAQDYDNPEEVMKWYYASKERLQDAESLALEESVVQWVLKQVNVVEQNVSFDELMGIA